MKTNKLRLLSTVLPALLLMAASMTVEAKPSNKWRLEFSGGADSDGAIVFRISPEGGAPIEATVDITKGTSENNVAKAVVKSLKAQLPKDGYHVERDDGEDVLVKKRRGAANFDVEIVANGVEGVRIKPERK
jgi:hypothetical protein